MIFVLPAAGDILQSSDLLQSAELFFRGLGKKFTPATLANQSVDLGHQGLGNDDMGSSSAHFKSHSMLTDYGIIFKARNGSARGESSDCELLPKMNNTPFAGNMADEKGLERFFCFSRDVV